MTFFLVTSCSKYFVYISLLPKFIIFNIKKKNKKNKNFGNEKKKITIFWNLHFFSTRQDILKKEKNINSIHRFYSAQKLNGKLLWKDPEILPDIVSNEIVVAGVYLRLFVSNPAWTLRKPKQFLSDLLDFVVDNISKTTTDKEVMELSTTALVELLRSQPNLADDIPVLGHIPKLFRLLPVQPKNTLSVLHQLSISEVRFLFLLNFKSFY